jgi:hypothetical protein
MEENLKQPGTPGTGCPRAPYRVQFVQFHRQGLPGRGSVLGPNYTGLEAIFSSACVAGYEQTWCALEYASWGEGS